MTWTNLKGHVLNLTCPITDHFFRCPSNSEDDSESVLSGELFIGVNFTALALDLENSTASMGYLDINANPLTLTLRYGPYDSGDSFTLFPNVHLRATLAVVHEQLITNTILTALGFHKVGGDAPNLFHRR